ncbi:MAG: tetratricopeptide repeat protein [Melioribacteraceae bacterium]|jgi:tetratricopeptide (TPR) repeat protein|nr:tetratricopeptide repeat protein [Melioribacteraceae bacterium]
MIKSNNIFFLLFVFINVATHSNLYSQELSRSTQLKASAIEQINAKKFSEAIDLLNKYISSAPRDTEGYTLRGTTFESIGRYQNAVLDLRRALKLDPNNINARTALARTEDVWHKQLRKKILGHEREIAINPDYPFNYLEIGKSYRWLEEWQTAEDWYDQYLARDDGASADEVIRYTEILAKNNHITKGEKILKKYVDRYPEDWRLWSRYGYFSLWLSKYKQSKKAFENALGFKPYFKEAQDGLDIVTRKAYVTQNDPRSFEKEFPIDRYYRILRHNSKNDEVRFKLADELITANRIEEAYQQLEILGINYSDDSEFNDKWENIVSLREDTYNSKIEELTVKVEENPTDKDAVLKLAEYYRLLEEYDEATDLLEGYLELVPDEKDPRVKFEYAHALAWNRYFAEAGEVLDELIEEHPSNLDYKLFRAQTAIWTENDIDLANEYVKEVIAKRPKNIDVLVAQATLLIIEENFDSSQAVIDIAKAIDSENNEVITIQTRLDFQIIRTQERKIYEILEEGQRVLKEEGCEEAIPYYEEYLEKATPNNIFKTEYGDVLFCAERYDEALVVYNEVLEDGYNYRTTLERGKLYYEIGDSLKSLKAFKFLVEEEPTEFQPRMFLGDSYSKIGEGDSALAVYDTLLTWELDSMQTYLVEQRISWIPPTGLKGILSSFPSSVGVAPQAQFYMDNLSFSMSKLGGRIELGVFQYLTFGVSFYRTNTQSNWESLDSATVHFVDSVSQNGFTGKREYTSFKGHVIIPFTHNMVLSVALGLLNTPDHESIDETEISFTYNNPNDWGGSLVYFASDANLILYSPYLIDFHFPDKSRMTASILKISGHYRHSTDLVFSSFFDYLTMSDGNEGNNFQLKMGYIFTEPFSAGYEYFYQNYKYPDMVVYYSPQNFDSHSLWVEFNLEDEETTKVVLGGKIGYAPQTSQLILEGHLNAKYQPTSRWTINGGLSLGQSSQFYSTYRYFSFNIAAYWSFW